MRFFLKASLFTVTILMSHGSAKETSVPKTVELEKAQIRPLIKTARLLGTVEAKHTSVLTAKAGGVLVSHASAGETVKKGALIAQLESADLERSYALAADAEKISKDQYERAVLLARSHNVSKQAVEEKLNNWIETQKTLTTSRIDLEKTRFIAPFDGMIGTFKVREGAQVKEDDLIVTIYDPQHIIVTFDIPAPLLPTIKVGQKIIFNEKPYTLTHVQKMIDPDTHMGPAFIEVDDQEAVIGETVTVDVIVAQHDKALTIPAAAVFLRNDNAYVYVIEENKTALRSVELGLREKAYVEVIEGLIEGEPFIAEGHARLHPGESVSVASSDKA